MAIRFGRFFPRSCLKGFCSDGCVCIEALELRLRFVYRKNVSVNFRRVCVCVCVTVYRAFTRIFEAFSRELYRDSLG